MVRTFIEETFIESMMAVKSTKPISSRSIMFFKVNNILNELKASDISSVFSLISKFSVFTCQNDYWSDKCGIIFKCVF